MPYIQDYSPIIFKQNLKHLMYLLATYNTDSSAKKADHYIQEQTILGGKRQISNCVTQRKGLGTLLSFSLN